MLLLNALFYAMLHASVCFMLLRSLLCSMLHAAPCFMLLHALCFPSKFLQSYSMLELLHALSLHVSLLHAWLVHSLLV
jgi:hypothetical protein